MEKLTDESRSLENNEDTPEEIIEMKVMGVNKIIADDIAQEEAKTQQMDVDKIPEFNKEASQIDAEREWVVSEMIAKAGALVVDEHNLDQKVSNESARKIVKK